MALNWNIEVIFALIGFIFFLIYTILIFKLSYSKRNKFYLILSITLLIFTGFNFFETIAYLFINKPFKQLSAMMYSLGLISLILTVDVGSKEKISYYKCVIAAFIIGCTFILVLIPENIQIYTQKYWGYPTLGVAGPLRYLNIFTLFLVGFQLTFWFYKIWRYAPPELKKKALELFVSNFIFYSCILFMFISGLWLILPINYLIAMGIMGIVIYTIYREPKLINILSFSIYRITIVSNHSGSPLFNLAWNLKHIKLGEEQQILAKWLPILQQLSLKFSKSLIVEEIKIGKDVLLFSHGNYVTITLISRNSTLVLRESLEHFVRAFELKFEFYLRNNVIETQVFETTTDLLYEFFPIGMPSQISQDKSLDFYLEQLIQKRTLDLEQKLQEKYHKDLEIEVERKTKKLNASLEKQKKLMDVIVKNSQFKTQIMSNMSHELRTPLNVIIGFTDLLLEQNYGTLNSEQLNFLNDIHSSALHLLDMINDILDITKIESGKLELDIQTFKLNPILTQVITSIKLLYEEKDVEIHLENENNDYWINADLIRFKEIFYNLLTNAMKYTPKGSVNVKIEESDKYWKFCIQDNGIGISKKDAPFIFKEFYRVNSEYVNKVSGTGLGLSLTKRLINLHGGNIWFKSKLNEGSIFFFTIPKNKSLLIK